MAHAAMLDVLNAIERRYTTYALDMQADSNASPEAAVVAAAQDVLVCLVLHLERDSELGS
jgi:hypothetical protein